MQKIRSSRDSTLEAIMAGLSYRKAEVEQSISEVRAALDGTAQAVVRPSASTPGRRRFSAETRARMAEAQLKRWAAVKGMQPAKKKRRLSPEGRARIIAATKKRWALKRSEG